MNDLETFTELLQVINGYNIIKKENKFSIFPSCYIFVKLMTSISIILFLDDITH